MTDVDERQLLRHLRTQLLRTARPATELQAGADGAVLAQLYERRVAIERELRALDPRLATFWGISPATCRETEMLLATHSHITVLQYFLSEERLLIFIIESEGTRAVHSEISKAELTGHIRRYRQLMQLKSGASASFSTGSSATEALFHEIGRRLYDALVAPLISLIAPGSPVCVVPHGVLHYVPFGALPAPDGTWHLDHFAVHYSTSASVLDWCYHTPIDCENTNIVAFANPASARAGDALPMAEEEARTLVARSERSRLFVQHEATKEAFWRFAPEASVLTLDLHNHLDARHPLNSTLQFADADGSNGGLAIREIYDRGRGTFKGRLAVAAVCDGNIGEDQGRGAEDDLTTLARALHYAGFPSVITTLWRVHDLSSFLLMDRFFELLLEARSRSGILFAGQALRQAQLDLSRMLGSEALTRCQAQRDDAARSDPTGRRAALIDLTGIAWIELQCGNIVAARQALTRASAALAHDDAMMDAINHDLPILEQLMETTSAGPNYGYTPFKHPYYWGAFVLLGRWEC